MVTLNLTFKIDHFIWRRIQSLPLKHNAKLYADSGQLIPMATLTHCCQPIQGRTAPQACDWYIHSKVKCDCNDFWIQIKRHDTIAEFFEIT